MAEVVGRKELTEVVLAAVSLANAGVAIAADGKVGLDDLGSLMVCVPKVVAAVDGIDKLPAELMDLSSEEGLAVVGEVAAALAIGDDKARKVVLASLKTLLGVKDIVLAMVDQPAAVTEAPQA